jgi:glycosyltransferase involved in cell wall biosynthesis
VPKSVPAPQPRPWSLRALARRLGTARRDRSGSDRGNTDDALAIARSGLFDPAFYVAQIAEPDQKPGKGAERTEHALIAHYLRKGASEWLNPSRQFDTGYYLDTHPAVAKSGENPLLHYIRSGRAAGAEPVATAADWSPGDVPSALVTMPATRRRRVFLVPAFLTERNTTRYRVRHLVELLGADAITIVDPDAPPEDFFPALDAGAIVILQRVPLTRENRVFLHRVRAAATLVAYDIDDQIFDANELEDWRIGGLEVSPARYARAMALADHFLVSTVGLRAKIERRFRRPAHVVTNGLGAETVARSLAAPRPDGGPFVIGYASGSHTHDEDLAVALPAVERFLRDNPAAEFHCIGRLKLPQAFRDAFGDRVRHRKAVPWRDLPDELARFSVQIVPLADCAFNRCKSHIRFLEAAAAGVPSVVSAVGEPAATVFDGVTGFVCGDALEEWCAALQRLHDDPALRTRMSEAGRRFVTEHFTTGSPFLKARIAGVFEDLELGFLRDRIGIVMATDDPAAAFEHVRTATSLPFAVYVAGEREGLPADVLAAPGGPGIAAGVNHLMALATERFLCVPGDEPLPPLWDLRLMQAAKSTPRLGWLSGSGASDGATADSLPAGIAVTPATRPGAPLLIPASAWNRIGPFHADAEGGIADDYGIRARRLGLYTGRVRGVLGPSPAPTDGPLVAIKICTPVAEDENVWGDTHYARGLQSALRTLGYRVRIDKREEWHDPARTADIAIHLFGTAQYRPDPAQTNVLWIISHPDRVDADFVRGFDVVFCASDVIAERVRRLAPETRVAVLLQCTDTTVFFPDPTVAKDIDVAFVGNSRKVYRDAVRFAVEEGFDVAIWGTRWEPFVDRRFICGASLTTEEVADVYRRARVVLNDHWDDQKAEALVNNRIFDVLACDTMVLSDANPGLPSILDGAVPTFADRAGFAATLRGLLADPDRDAAAARLGAEVRRAHTFAQRAAAIHEAIAALPAIGDARGG